MSSRNSSLFAFLLGSLVFWFLLIRPVLGQSADPWQMFRQNASNTGVSPLNGPLLPDLAWRFNTAGFTYSSPTLTGNALYVTSDDQLLALNLDGSLRWSVTLSEAVEIDGVDIQGIVSTPAVSDNGTIFVGSLDGMVYAVSANGAILWSFDTGEEVFSSPTIGPDGTVYVGSRSGSVYALNPDGTLRWSVSLLGEFFSTPALSADGSTLYAGSTENVLYALDAATGAQLPGGAFVESEIVSSPAVGQNGTVYFGTVGNRVYAINGQNGSLAWPQPFETDGSMVSSPAISPNGTLYIGSFNGTLYAINSQSGTLKWTFSADDAITASPAIDGNGWIYITSLDGSLYVLEDLGAQASLRWSFEAGDPVWASPSIGPGNIVYIAASGTETLPGTVFAIGQALYDVSLEVALRRPVAGQDLPLSVRSTAGQAPISGTLYHRSASETQFTPIPFNGGMVTIPAIEVTEDGIAYYVEGPDGTFPDRAPSTRPISLSVFTSRATSQVELIPRRYKMVSAPFTLRDPEIAAVLDEYGPYGGVNWRLLRWTGTAYQEFPNIDVDFEPGAAFFLITDSGDPFDVLNATSVNTSTPFSIALQPGWNQVANPFGFPVSADPVLNVDDVAAIAYYDGIEMIQDPASIPTLDPWEGYFIYNQSQEAAAIQIPNTPASTSADQNTAEKNEDRQGVRLQLIASVQNTDLRDSQNWVGFHPNAREGADPMDIIEAPPFGDHVRLSIEGEHVPHALDFKPLSAQGASWTVTLSRSFASERLYDHPVFLSFAGFDQLPDGFDVALIDRDLKVGHLVSPDRITIDWDASVDLRRFRLIVGPPAFIAGELEDLPIAPATPSLAQNFPNPFRLTTTIQYQLDQRSHVSLVVYDALGREVRSLVDDTQLPGTFTVVWDGHDDAGRSVPSGMYMYRLKTNTYLDAGQMIRVR